MQLKKLSAKCQPFYSGLNVLIGKMIIMVVWLNSTSGTSSASLSPGLLPFDLSILATYQVTEVVDVEL